MKSLETASRRRPRIATLSLAFGLSLACVAGLSVPGARAQIASEAELQAQKDHWQERYRVLLREEARLELNARLSRDDYAQAQRRNYPRGGARQQLLAQAAAAEAELEKVRQEINAFRLEARRENVLPGWLFEVEDENIVIPRPAARDASGPVESQDQDRGGRNPLYLDDEADDS